MAYMSKRYGRIADDLIPALSRSPAERDILAAAGVWFEYLTEPGSDIDEYIRRRKNAAEATSFHLEQVLWNVCQPFAVEAAVYHI
jgi:hypothetical protein